jgi:tetratricopeptide (TPR) repeat protein
VTHAGDAESSASPRAQGIEHFHRNDYPQALACFDSSLSIHPADRELYNYKARALEGLGRFAESLTCIDRCLELNPNNVAELCNRALMLTKLLRRDEALATFDRVLATQPNNVDVLIKRAFLLHQIDRRDDALISADRAVSLAPADLNALNARGMILDDMGRRDEALADFQAVLAIDPGYSDAITNRGITYGRSGQFREALACYDQSLSLNPHQPNAFYNRAVVRLVLGDWSQGFRDFESRWKLFPHEAARLTRLAPRWSGERNVAGKTILLHHEQGFGDTLQFCRYIPLVTQLGARVVVATPAGLRRLLTTLPGSPRIVSEGEPVPAHDYHCPLMSLPLAFDTTPSTVPAQIPYLRADRNEVKRWAERLGERKRLRLGVVWSGRRFPPINHTRDMTLDAIRPLFALNADFICLHTELSDAERAQLTSLPNVVWWGGQLGDFADTAALVDNLDVVITVDSAVAHLAGALGKPVWLMNRYASCWRWLLERRDSPWYPSMRLFRQPALGDWASVMRDVLEAGVLFTGGQGAQREVGRPSGNGSLAPTTPDLAGLLQRGLHLHNGGELVGAIAAYRRVLDLLPDQFDGLHYLGVALAQMRRFEEALTPLARAIEIRPESAVAHNHYGNALAGLSRFTEAIRSYERAIGCDNGFADSHYNCGVAYVALGQREVALACFTQAIEFNSGYAQAFNNRGIVLSELDRVPEALADYEHAIRARPEFVDAWVNRADVLRRLHRYEEALECGERALRVDPHHHDAHNSRGAILADLGRYDEATASYNRAVELNPSSAEALWNKGLIELSRGDLGEGWKHYESRWRVRTLKLTKRFPGIPPWRGGESVKGKIVLLHAEQGYGDTIQFSRFCVDVAALGARVILSAPKALRSLFKSLRGVHEFIEPTTIPAFDFHCPLMSVPLALGTTLDSIPAPVRYLQADTTATARWTDRLRARQHAPTVGLVWSGRHTQQGSRAFDRFTAVTSYPSISSPMDQSTEGCRGIG